MKTGTAIVVGTVVLGGTVAVTTVVAGGGYLAYRAMAKADERRAERQQMIQLAAFQQQQKQANDGIGDFFGSLVSGVVSIFT